MIIYHIILYHDQTDYASISLVIFYNNLPYHIVSWPDHLCPLSLVILYNNLSYIILYIINTMPPDSLAHGVGLFLLQNISLIWCVFPIFLLTFLVCLDDECMCMYVEISGMPEKLDKYNGWYMMKVIFWGLKNFQRKGSRVANINFYEKYSTRVS